ncbi:hypothetical protein Y032_0685g1517 [Ancylostoma ceylanicum]|uniref:Uncharacterized protein n=1 Tax=Ancylostoma ceylanicum TaxID=53326 RepID=A0A016WI42_9BILA|nr:hypothetical protein Y032_0685g1517 [Ancylostoma ceylanicum]
MDWKAVKIFAVLKTVCWNITSPYLTWQSVMTTSEHTMSELNVVMLGSPQKNIMFEKLCQAATKYERHVHYQDVHYLTVNCAGKQEVIEFTDPGLAHTGGREMAIKRADLALLFYSAISLSSLQHLKALQEDLVVKKNVSTPL